MKAPNGIGAIELVKTSWSNAPIRAIVDDRSCLSVEVAGSTNFWQGTRHGRREDNGHFLGVETVGDVELEVTVDVLPNSRYDQAGLMIRASSKDWIKTSAEYDADSTFYLGAVVTRGGWSDWSSCVVRTSRHRLRMRRIDDTVTIDAADSQQSWSQIRVAHFDVGPSVMAGVYACAPTGDGFTARFEDFHMSPLGGPGAE